MPASSPRRLRRKLRFQTGDEGIDAGGNSVVALGANVAIVGRNQTRTRVAAARVKAARRMGATVDTFIADLSSQASVRKLAGEVLGRYPRLDVLINNAGAMYARCR